MKNLVPLFQREWLQHRFGWGLLAGVPVLLALVLVGFGQVEIGGEETARIGDAMPTVMTLVSIAASTGLLFVIAWITSIILVTGLSRRDHADRSIEFWLSLPVSHSESLAAPLLVHLILVPAAALLVGLAAGLVISLVLVGRFVGLGAWFALPWGDIVAASLAIVARLLAGLPLATLWLSPLILLVVLATAWFRRWGLVILAVGVGLGSLVLERLFGQPMLSEAISGLVRHALLALAGASRTSLVIHGAEDAYTVLRSVPAWALADLTQALRELASPLLAGGLLFAAACFALVVDWRRRGAGAAG